MLHRARRAVDVGRPQLGAQQMLATKDVQGQVAVAVVVAVKEPPQLMAVDRIIRGVEVQHDLFRRHGMQTKKCFHKERFDVAMPSDHFLVAALFIGSNGRQLQPIQRTLARQRLATISRAATILARRIDLSHQDGQERIPGDPGEKAKEEEAPAASSDQALTTAPEQAPAAGESEENKQDLP